MIAGSNRDARISSSAGHFRALISGTGHHLPSIHFVDRKRSLGIRRTIALLIACWPLEALAHVFAQPYALPVPFAYYAWGAAMALVASFALTGALQRLPASEIRTAASPKTFNTVSGDRETLTRQCVGLTLLVVCIITGLIGTVNPYANFNMTFFWVIFVLGVPYVVSIIGDFYAPFNPWRALVSALEVAIGKEARGISAIALGDSYAPALVLYIAFIFLELFGHLTPKGLSVALIAYTGINVLGAFSLGKQWWFKHGEFFAVITHLLGKMSFRPCGWGSKGHGRTVWQAPFLGLLGREAKSLTLVTFILFMLSSTAFDGLHNTVPFTRFFFGTVYPAIEPLLAGSQKEKFAMSASLYYVWQWSVMILSPFVYLALLLAIAKLMKIAGRSTLSSLALVRRFALTLVPIGLVYHITHYYSLLLAQAPQLWRIASDPFGFRWNLFGTANSNVQPVMISAGILWASQVGIILFGHVASSYLAHIVALRTYDNRRSAIASQIPMLLLMVLLTTFGLWILSLPLLPGA